MLRKITLGVALMAMATMVTTGIRADHHGDSKKGTSIEDVMHALKDGFHKKILDGSATDEEKAQMLDFAKALPKGTPPKGSKSSWKKLTKKLVVASKAVVAGKDGAIEAFGEAINCKTCHTPHKVYPPEKQ
ncbi:MAG: hypothetical protein MK006_01670 [Pirellulales bacterium]|nr:hypothetical protein [Pirellulales bacterium]|tara:strand:- start:631 stop:1023 length:393 start_codon:yes stop_codon:yes gene_type:complete